jgi:uncharacterized RDD family membrane protein YckC
MPPPPPGPQPLPPGGGGMVVPGNLANPWLRIVGGLIDVILLAIVIGAVNRITNDTRGLLSVVVGVLIYIAYFTYFLSQRGQTVGMMLFGYKVRDLATGQYPDPGKSALRGFIWYLEVLLTICIVGIVGWAWQLWDPQKQAIHDKVAGTIVTTG